MVSGRLVQAADRLPAAPTCPMFGCVTESQEPDDHPARDPGPAARASGRRVPRGRRHVGRRRQLVRGGAPGRGRLRGDRHHAAALRPRRGARQEGRLLRRPGHPRCARASPSARHPPLRARFRGAVSPGGDRGFRGELRCRPDADPLRALQSAHQVRRSPGHRARSRRGCARDRPLRAARVGERARIELHRAADARRDQSYFLFATTPEQLEFLRFPLGGLAKAETRAWPRASPCPWPTSRTARTSASCRTAPTPRSWRSCAPARPSRARSCTSTAACSAGTTG